MSFVAVKSLAGQHFIRATEIIAVSVSDPVRCNIYITGGAMLPATEPAASVIAKVDAALAGKPAPDEPKKG
jgi:hypothetical protein